jgi:hypothetical protein
MTEATFTIGLGMLEHCPRHPGGWSRALHVFSYCETCFYGFGCPRRALNGPFWRLSAWAVIKAEAAAAAVAPSGGATDGMGWMALTVVLGLGRTVALYCRSSTSYQIH